MSQPRDGRLRLSILGGYLGAGKTTWLQHQLHHTGYRDARVIVNEASEVPVDQALLPGANLIAVLSGGCVCCEARGRLVALLRELCDARSAVGSNQERIEAIVLETSGLADPGAIMQAIESDPVLLHHIVVDEIIVAVDALNALDQIRSEPLARGQIEVADRLVITKVDAADDAQLSRLMATLRRINPAAELAGAARGAAVSLPMGQSGEPESLPELAAESACAPVLATTLVLEPALDWTAFSVWLSALLHARGNEIVRVKGVVRTPAGRLLLQSVRKAVQSPQILPEAPDRRDNVLAVIGRGYRPEDLGRSLRHFTAAAGTGWIYCH